MSQHDFLLERIQRNIFEISRLLDIVVINGQEGKIDATLLRFYAPHYDDGYLDSLVIFAQTNGALRYCESGDHWEVTDKGKLIRQLSFDEEYVRAIFESHADCSLRTLLEELQDDQEYSQNCQNSDQEYNQNCQDAV